MLAPRPRVCLPPRAIRLPPSNGPGIPFKAIGRAALADARLICERILPGGRVVGNEYVVRNPKRLDRRPGSLKVNLCSGRWSDFAIGDRGGDLISLVAWRFDLSQADAAKNLAHMLRIRVEQHNA
jgi:hypothetical protein